MMKRRDLRKKELRNSRKNKRGEKVVVEENFRVSDVKTNNDIAQCLVLIDERQKRMAKDVEAIKKKIYGDGREELIIEINSMKTTLRNVIFGLAFVFTVLSLVVVLMNIFTW